MHHVAVVGKVAIVLVFGAVSAIVSGGVHSGITAGQLLTGGGGIILGLAILKASSEMGRLRQMVDNHEGRLKRIENNEDRAR
jgi:hypothetical protein